MNEGNYKALPSTSIYAELWLRRGNVSRGTPRNLVEVAVMVNFRDSHNGKVGQAVESP